MLVVSKCLQKVNGILKVNGISKVNGILKVNGMHNFLGVLTRALCPLTETGLR